METQSPTIGTAIGSKLATVIERSSLKQIGLFFLAGILSAVMLRPDFISFVLRWNHSAVPTVLIIHLVVFNAHRLRLLVPEKEEDTIEGIPTVELLDHLFTVGSFRRDDIEAKFKIPRYRVVALSKKLKELGLLTHGENNLSVLNPEFSRQDVASILDGCTSASELRPLFRRDGRILTSEPSASRIAGRVEELLAPPPRAPGFATRELATAS